MHATMAAPIHAPSAFAAECVIVRLLSALRGSAAANGLGEECSPLRGPPDKRGRTRCWGS